MSEFLSRSRSRRGHRRSRYYTSECLVLDAVRQKPFFKSGTPTTVIEFPGLMKSIDVNRIADDRLLLSRCPPPLDQQEVELACVPWGPDGSFKRYFFRCAYCARRVAKLYVPWGGSGWACRTCHGITYKRGKAQLDVLLAQHAEIAQKINRLSRLRARAKQHMIAPGTADEVERHVEVLLGEVEALDRKVSMHAGVLGP